VLSCGENTSVKWRVDNSTLSASLCAQGPGVVSFLRIGGMCRGGLFLDLIGFQMDWSLCLSVEMYVVNLSLLRLCIAVLSLLLALLNSRRSPGACVL
jgi:hypothetical protein